MMIGTSCTCYHQPTSQTKTTTVEEFDKAGKLVKKTTTTETVYANHYCNHYHAIPYWTTYGTTTSTLGGALSSSATINTLQTNSTNLTPYTATIKNSDGGSTKTTVTYG